MSDTHEELLTLAKKRVADRIEAYYANKYGGLRYLHALTLPIDTFVIKYCKHGFVSKDYTTSYEEMKKQRAELIDHIYNFLGLEFSETKDLIENPALIDEIFGRVRADCLRFIEPKSEHKGETKRSRR